MKTRSWTPLPLGPLPGPPPQTPGPFLLQCHLDTPPNPRDQLSKGAPRTHPIRNSCSRERCRWGPHSPGVGVRWGGVRRGGEGWGGTCGLRPQGLREAGNRRRRQEGEKPRTPPREAGPPCSSPAVPREPAQRPPTPTPVRSSAHSLGAALHSLMRLTSQTADCRPLPSTQCPLLEPLPAPQDHQGPLSEEDWGSPGLGPWGQQDVLADPGHVAGHPVYTPGKSGSAHCGPS